MRNVHVEIESIAGNAEDGKSTSLVDKVLEEKKIGVYCSTSPRHVMGREILELSFRRGRGRSPQQPATNITKLHMREAGAQAHTSTELTPHVAS